MVGAEWRKASRVFDALMEKLKANEYVGDDAYTAQMMEAWGLLPQSFRDRMEKVLLKKQATQVREQVEKDLDDKKADYERRKLEYQQAATAYNTKVQEARDEQRKLDSMKSAVAIGEALATFCKTIGIESSKFTWPTA